VAANTLLWLPTDLENIGPEAHGDFFLTTPNSD